MSQTRIESRHNTKRDFCAILDKWVCTTTLFNIDEDEYDNISKILLIK